MNCGYRKIVFNSIFDILPLHFVTRILLDTEGDKQIKRKYIDINDGGFRSD